MEKRHISTQKLDFYAEHACFCAEGVAFMGHRTTLRGLQIQIMLTGKYDDDEGVDEEVLQFGQYTVL